MSFFKRNKDPYAIPAVPPTQAQEKAQSFPSPQKQAPSRAPQTKPDPYAQSPATSTGGRGGDPYARANGNGDPYARSGGDPYAQTASGRDSGNPNPYARDAPNPADAARNELFAGYKGPEKVQKEREYGYEGREMEEDFDEDEEIEGIKQEMRGIKQESLASTRNALRLAREVEDTARGTIAKLSDQSERIANSERYIDMAKANNQRAEDKAAELKQLNKSIFKPVVVWNKDAKRQAQEDKISERHAMERADRAKANIDMQETHKRLGGAANPSPYGGYGRTPLPGEQKAKKDARARYQFDATASDDELEDELDENLDETLEVTKRLKNLATAMNGEVQGQTKRIGRIEDGATDLEFGLMKNTERLKKIR